MESVRPDSISIRDAALQVYRLLKDITSETDPAPWFDVPAVLIEIFAEGDESGFVRRKKLEERTKLLVHRAVLLGELPTHFSDGTEAKDLPAWAWVGAKKDDDAWFSGRLEISPLLPDEWYSWSGKPVFVDCGAFDHWLANQDLTSIEGLPALPKPIDEIEAPDPIEYRVPPDRPFVSLSEAISWIGFRISFDCNRLTRAIDLHAFGDPSDTEAKLEKSVSEFATLGCGGKISARGRYRSEHFHDNAAVLTEAIEPIRFHDFAMFDCLTDTLRYGEGLTWRKQHDVGQLIVSKRRDSIEAVAVSRPDLLRHFPERPSAAKAFLTPLPISLPNIGPIIGLEEALSWTAHGTPSHDIAIWQNEDGGLVLIDPCGVEVAPGPNGEDPEFVLDHRAAHRAVHEALRSGTLPSYVSPIDEQPFSIPRSYWNRINPDCLDMVYLGLANGDRGVGSPILLSRQAFDDWRATFVLSESKPSRTGDLSTAGAERNCKAWLAAAFAADPEKRRSKASFRTAALKEFDGRLSIRGFDLRVWPELARSHGRDGAGAKRKS
jgi:hypothetical protein